MNAHNVVYAAFVSIASVVGYALSQALFGGGAVVGAVLGALLGFLLVVVLRQLKKQNVKRLCWASSGFVLGLVAGAILNTVLDPLLAVSPLAASGLKGLSLLFFAYIGATLALRVEEDPNIFETRGEAEQDAASPKILDTSVIIDGRIGDLSETGFLEGAFITPQFILQELQHIADSSDSMKRARGRRGLDVLHRLQQMPDIEVRIVDTDFPAIREVDAKIVALGKAMNAKILTNDLNLNKVAELQGVHVLNINELCNALKPVVLPGELMQVFVLKEGKEHGQGIAYLDDGTMIVIDEARKSIGKNVQITVTSVLQTPAGRMIFSRMREEIQRDHFSRETRKTSVPIHEGATVARRT